jgi:hypothetical protein
MLYLVYLQNFISKYNILWLMQKKMIREWHTILFSQMFFIFAQKNYHHSTIVCFFFLRNYRPLYSNIKEVYTKS